jgi:FkbM family methyltransferase
VTHHPVFDRFEPWSGEVGPGWDVNFLGVRTREEFTAGMNAIVSSESGWVNTDYPHFDEEYFEWVDVLEAAAAAAETFTMIELGAGWGRWLCNAAGAIRQHDRLPLHLVGVEAEPTHFRWMLQHFRDNDVDATSLTLIQAAVAGDECRVRFHVGDPSAWYGQAIELNEPTPDRRFLRLRRLKALLERQPARDERTIVDVRAVTLPTILHGLRDVDLIDLDVQGVEADVLESAGDVLSRSVRRIHVGTHSTENEERLRALFGRLGWEKLNDYACGTEAETAWGVISFQDGVQTWQNPWLATRA